MVVDGVSLEQLGANTDLGVGETPPRLCKQCLGVVTRRGGGPWPTYCSQRCKSKAAYQRAKEEGRSKQWLEKATARRKAEREAAARPCPYCGVLMESARRKQCGQPDCQRAFENERQRRFFATWKAANGTPYTSRYKEQRTQIHRKYVVRVGHWRKRYPLRALAEDKRRKKRLIIPEGAESFTHEEIFERDGWRCGHCRNAIDKTLSYPQPQSASLDHIVPLAEGGEHTRANVRASHLYCNVSRGHRGGGEQLVLIG
jgi:5-methylcytosine-specific restriction endonuclease McrA